MVYVHVFEVSDGCFAFGALRVLTLMVCELTRYVVSHTSHLYAILTQPPDPTIATSHIAITDPIHAALMVIPIVFNWINHYTNSVW